jgi:diguanylate cyclase (GGDEF)-like protein
MAGSVLLLVWMLEAELRRRAAAENAAAVLARTDGLTKLANRRAFEEGLSREWARSARYGRPMSLIMIDVDQFKLFNDTYGHQAGDDTLTAIAGIIAQASKRPGDLAARFGGEEFAILLPDTDQRGAIQIADAIRDGVSRLRIDHAGSDHKIVTISAGVAMRVLHSRMTATSLVHDADAALYRAKALGRNATCGSNVLSATEFEPQLNRAV